MRPPRRDAVGMDAAYGYDLLVIRSGAGPTLSEADKVAALDVTNKLRALRAFDEDGSQ